MLEIAANPTLQPQALLERVEALAGEAYRGGRLYRGDPIARLAPEAVRELGLALRDDPELRFEMLMDVTAVHWPLESGREFELVYQYRSIRNNLYVRVTARIADGAAIASLAPVFRSADWLEREVFDLFGIVFEGHPNLKRILLPEGYEGHPLRKEYPVEGPNFPEDAHRSDLFGRLDPDDFWAGTE